MRIPRDFDRWMFDYKEGNLSHSENSYFENYMSENPQLDSDVNAWNNSYVRKQDIAYPGLSSLQKESKLKLYIGWAATILIIIGSSIGGFNYLNNSISSLYSLRQTKLVSNQFNTTSNQNSKFQHSKLLKSVKPATTNITTSNNSKFITTPNNVTVINKKNSNDLNNNTRDFTNNSFSEALKQVEINKINNTSNLNSENNSASYKNNPTFIESDVKNTKTKYKKNYSKSILRTLKNSYRKIEKITGYPIGLTNLKDPEFLTPIVNLFDVNSAFVGGSGNTRFQAKYKTQWLGSEHNLQTSLINFDTYIKSIRGGFGISLINNNFNNGLFTDNKVNLIYSPKFALTSKVIFEPAIKLSLGIMTLDQTKTNTNGNFETERGFLVKTFQSNDIFTANNLWYKDYGLGFVLNTEKLYFGFNADNLARHNQSIYGKNIKSTINYTAVLGMDYQSRNKKMLFSPFVTYQNNSIINELWAGANFKYHWLTIGGGYSTKNDFSAELGIKTRNFKLSYQYDMTTSLLNSQQMGSHSIGLRINSNRKK